MQSARLIADALASHSKGLSPTMIHHQIKTRDDVTIHVVETGNLPRSAVLFVHGISQSWRSWLAQFADPRLRERFRLVALDLRGHGESQGAFGAVDQEGNPLPALADERYNDGNVETTCRLWAYDLDATIEALRLDHPCRDRLVGRRVGRSKLPVRPRWAWRHREGDAVCVLSREAGTRNGGWRGTPLGPSRGEPIKAQIPGSFRIISDTGTFSIP